MIFLKIVIKKGRNKYIVVTLLCKIRYFEDDDEPPSSSLEYIPAPGSPTYDLMKKSALKEESDDEEDTLDAFMAGIDAEVKRNNCAAECGDNRKEEKSKGFRADIDGEDDEESYYRCNFCANICDVIAVHFFVYKNIYKKNIYSLILCVIS